jgi:gluconate 2-dehydrogenase gamma chain
MEGMFSDPIYGGNRNKAAWKMVGYPGVVAVYATHIVNYRNKKYVVDPVSIADLL